MQEKKKKSFCLTDGGSTAHSCVSRREGLHVSDVGSLGLVVLVLPVADVIEALRCGGRYSRGLLSVLRGRGETGQGR